MNKMMRICKNINTSELTQTLHNFVPMTPFINFRPPLGRYFFMGWQRKNPGAACSR